MYENMAKNKKCAECGSLVVLATRFHPLSQKLIVDCCKKATIRVKTDNRIEKSRSGLGGAVQGILLREAVCSHCIHKTFFAFAPFHKTQKQKVHERSQEHKGKTPRPQLV